MTFPDSLRTVAQGAFSGCRSLRKAVLNEGLEVLGTDEQDDCKAQCGVFQESTLEDVRLPTTLRRIGLRTFADCRSLARI